jgi:hypothetical protein
VINMAIGAMLAADGFTGLVRGQTNYQMGLGGILVGFFALAVVAGGLDMIQLESLDWAVAGCAVAMIPGLSPCCLGLPIGAWGLVTLLRPEVRRAFGKREMTRSTGPNGPGSP